MSDERILERRELFRRSLLGGAALWLPDWWRPRKKTYLFQPGLFKPPKRLWRVELADYELRGPIRGPLLAFYHHFDDGTSEGPFGVEECEARHRRWIAAGRVVLPAWLGEHAGRGEWERRSYTTHRLVLR